MSSNESHDPSTAPRRESRSGRTVRQYSHGEVSVRIRGLDGAGQVRVHIEHKSGAALIVPFCSKTDGKQGPELATTGFDGTDYHMSIDEVHNTLTVTASAPSPILGDLTTLTLKRVEDLSTTDSGALRVTGDEDTMPIVLKKPV